MQKHDVKYCTDVPIEAIKLAEKRTDPILRHYGKCITGISIQTLVASAYLQGVSDCREILEKDQE
jgi:hypothetical protein